MFRLLARFLLASAFALTLAAFPPVAGAVQNPHALHLISLKNQVSSKPKAPEAAPVVAPPGAVVYEAHRGDSIPSISRQYLNKTTYLTSSQLADAIREANGNRQGTFLHPGEQIIVPGILDAPIVEKTVAVPKDFEVRAIYLTGVMAGSDHGLRIIRHWHEVGGNAVVFDIKDSDGIVNIAFDQPAGQRAETLHPRPAQVHPLSAFAEHARHRPRRHLSRRASRDHAS